MRTIDREMRKPSRSNSTALRTMQKEEDAADGEKGLHGRHRRAEELMNRPEGERSAEDVDGSCLFIGREALIQR
jgi:hypothetical protein